MGDVDKGGLTLPPPEGCVKRAIWCGYDFWTKGGEAFALKLDKSFTPGTTYEYTFTYANDGVGPAADFSPILYTNSSPVFSGAHKIGRLPGSQAWRTATFQFKAKPEQSTDVWLIVHAFESSGMILANCFLKDLSEREFLRSDTTICLGDDIKLTAPTNPFYEYKWSNGSTTNEIIVQEIGRAHV